MPCVFFPTQAIDQSGGVVCVRARHTRRRAQAVIRKRGAPKKKVSQRKTGAAQQREQEHAERRRRLTEFIGAGRTDRSVDAGRAHRGAAVLERCHPVRGRTQAFQKSRHLGGVRRGRAVGCARISGGNQVLAHPNTR